MPRAGDRSPGPRSFTHTRAPSLSTFFGLATLISVSAYWWRNQQVSVSQGSAQEFAKKLVDQGADAVFKASDLDGDGTLNQEEFSLAIADQQMGFAKFEVCGWKYYGDVCSRVIVLHPCRVRTESDIHGVLQGIEFCFVCNCLCVGFRVSALGLGSLSCCCHFGVER